MEWQAWSSLPLTERAQLPAHPGIYVIVDVQDEVWYVGRTINLKARWNGNSHHRYRQLSRANHQRRYKIHWQVFPADQLQAQEQQYIHLFNPHLNYSRVKPFTRKPVQPSQEISRILKVLNRQTRLFPLVRSVVLGYYTEVDEAEDGCLREVVCIMIAVNVNDHNGPILNSVKKSLSRRGNSLKGAWKTFESNCGSEDPAQQPAVILVFLGPEIVYEFICAPQLLTKLEEHPTSLHCTELEHQMVLALKDPRTLTALIDEPLRPQTAQYLQYRAPDLYPLQAGIGR